MEDKGEEIRRMNLVEGGGREDIYNLAIRSFTYLNKVRFMPVSLHLLFLNKSLL